MIRHLPMIHARWLFVLPLLCAACAGTQGGFPFPVRSEGAPAALGPYSQAKGVRLGERSILFLSGQVGIDPATGRFAEGGIMPETRQVMANLQAVLAAAGATMGDVLSVTVYLTDMADYEVFNRIYAESFQDIPPARACVQVAALPKGARVEIACVALGR
jgi:2-iminobutanoate/2-iminopropanoate deaminase